MSVVKAMNSSKGVGEQEAAHTYGEYATILIGNCYQSVMLRNVIGATRLL